METAVTPPADADLHLLTSWEDPSDRPRRREAGVLSVLLHAAVISMLALLPKSWLEPPPPVREAHLVTPLVEPFTDLTQKAPNKGKINKEFDIPAAQPRPRIQIPAGPPSTTRPQAFHPAALPPIPAPKPAALPEPPKIEASETKPELPLQLPQARPPQLQPVEKPKLAFETPAAAPAPEPGQGRRLPRGTADEAITGALHGGVMVGQDSGGPGGFGPSVNLPPSPGTQPNNMQLLSDPMGVDFRPYLTQVLAAVKRYWLLIWPESARMGRSGRVALQFSINRTGGVPKLVIASSSGVDSLDRAAVAAVSGANPFPPLPRDFRGDLIKLQLNFAYNIPK